MDSRVVKRLESKIKEIISRKAEIGNITESAGKDITTPYAMAVGMLYNSFYYQTRRICSREPTPKEISEFIEMLVKRRSSIQKDLS